MARNYYNDENLLKLRRYYEKYVDAIRAGERLSVTISNGNSKMGPVASVSLLPFITCPACCRGTCGPECYAAKIALLYSTVGESYGKNTALALYAPARFWDDVRHAARAVRYFRYHVSGDIPSAEYFSEIVKTAELIPGTEFLLFTKRFQFANAWIDAGNAIPGNLHIMFSGWTNLTPENPHKLPETNVFDKANPPRESWKQCGGNCFSCACRGVGCWTACPGDTIAFKKR